MARKPTRYRSARQRSTRRAPGEGSVFYDESKKCWVGTLDAGRNPDTGKRRRPKVSAPTQDECLDLLDEMRRQFKTTGIVPRRDTTVKQVVEDWLANPPPRVKSDKTREGHAIFARRIIAELGSVPVVKLSPGQVEMMLRRMVEDGYATDTIKKTRSVLVRSLNRAERDGLLTRNVAAIVQAPTGAPGRESRAMNTMQVRQLLGGLTPWWTAWVTTGAMLGFRPGEMLGLAWDDVDFGEKVVRVRFALKKGKDDQGRTILVREELKTKRSRRSIEMPQAVVTALLALRRVQAADQLRLGKHWEDSGLVFCTTSGGPMWITYAWRKFKELCDEAGLGDWTLRETRHTFVSVLSDAGVDIEKIADAAGHANSTVTRTVYRHQLTDTVSDAARVMDDIWGAGGQAGGAAGK